ncbi:MAG: insulinase family protein [candidate division Zixibacteria bacterium]|nr:insulinase family protein [candidate division Zixibacteria bacterium]
MFKSIGRCFLAVLFLLFICQSGFGQISFPVEKHVLDNGLTVLISEDHSAPVVTYQVWYKVGSRNERPGITGISHLCEHMMFKGSKNIGPQEHARLIQANGGISNAWTSFDMTCYWEKLANDKLELAINLESERHKNLTPTPENFTSEREVVKEERRMGVDNSPFGAVFEQMLNTTFVAHPYHWHVIGFMSDIDNITLDDLKNHYKVYYAPNNAIAVVVGDVNPKEVMKLMHKYYDDIPAQPPPPKVGTVEPEQKGERIAYVHKIAQMPAFMVGYHIPEFGHPDTYPLSVAARVLFTGQSSRLYQKMIYQDQSALHVGGDCFSLQDPGVFYCFAIMQPGHTAEGGRNTLFEEINKLKNEPMDEKELQKAKNQLEAEFIFNLQSVSDKGSQIGYYQTVLGDYSKLFEEAEKFQQVTAEDVVRVAKKYFDEKNRNVVVLVPEMPEQPTPATE